MDKDTQNQPMANISGKVLMIRPHRFRSNQMTSVNNYYQQQSSSVDVHDQALKEFNQLVDKLRKEGVQVIVVQDQGKNDTPDSVFPNNWVSFHHEHNYNVYPLYAQNRRKQRCIDVFTPLKEHGMNPKLWKDYSKAEKKQVYLEGTGSLVLDRVNKIAYAAISERTHEDLAHKFCEQNGYKPCFFRAYQTVNGKRQLIYHTNVMLWIGLKVCGVCLKCIDDQNERQNVRKSLTESKLNIVELSEDQVANFAGNSIMLKGKEGPFVVMSSRAYSVLTNEQINKIGVKIVHSDLKIIQDYGGGSARCTIAELF